MSFGAGVYEERKMTKIQLISVPVDKGKISLYEDGAFAPLGLIWLANYLKKYGHDVEIIDGQHADLNEINSQLSAPFVGVSFNILSTASLDEIVKNAKNKGSSVIVGGQAATPLSHRLLTNPNIDYVVRYDGEEALRFLAEGRNIKEIPNLTYRNEEGIVDNHIQLMDLTKLPLPSWNIKGINIANYWNRFQGILTKVRTNHKHQKPLSSFTKKGCPYRQGENGCSFCSRIDTALRNKTPQQVYSEFQYLVSLGADRIEEFSDSWLYNKKWLREFADLIKQERHWGVPVRVYADIRHINPETIRLMQTIGIDSVILGVESGNGKILRQNGKPNTIEQILKCAELLGQAKIKASPSYVLGLVGETKKTIDDTFRVADQIKDKCEIEMSYFSIMTPFPGSKAWGMLIADPLMREKYAGYKLDNKELQEDFIERFTHLGKEGLAYLSQQLEERFQTNGIAQRDY